MSWAVYAKQYGRWLMVGDPCLEEEARQRVTELQQKLSEFQKKKLRLPLGAKPLLVEAHCVPI